MIAAEVISKADPNNKIITARQKCISTLQGLIEHNLYEFVDVKRFGSKHLMIIT